MPSIKKKLNLRIFYPGFKEKQPEKKSVQRAIQTTIKLDSYHSLGIGKSRRAPKPNCIRLVQRHPKLQPFLGLFRKIAKNARSCCRTYQKDFDIFKQLDWIVPDEFFGCSKHRKLFYGLVRRLLSRSSVECVYTRTLICKFRFRMVPWLINFHDNVALWRRLWYLGNLWLIQKIVKPIINYFYYSLKDAHTYRIKHIPKHLWCSYEAKVFNFLEQKRWIIEVGNKYRPQVHGILRVYPKNGLHDCKNFRAIMNLLKERRHAQKFGSIYHYARLTSSTETGDFSRTWIQYTKRTKNQKVYAVKLDVSDAYGNVDISYLTDIIGSFEAWPMQVKTHLTMRLQKQYVTLAKSCLKTGKVYRWNHGLLQGDQFSSALCELYMSHIDRLYLTQFYKTTTLIHRTVDDYFFCSIDKEDITSFIKVMGKAHKLNTNKTQSNVYPYNNEEIEYCGKLVNIRTREIKGLYKFKAGTNILHRFKLWKRDQPLERENFLLRAMYFPYNNYHFCRGELNTMVNSEDTVLQNYFYAMVYVSFKFDAAVMAIYNVDRINLFGRVLSNTIWHYSYMTVSLIEKFRGDNYTGAIKFFTLVKIAYQAFWLVLNRRSLKYKKVLAEIKKAKKRIRLKQFRPNDFRTLPECFRPIRMSRRVNILTS